MVKGRRSKKEKAPEIDAGIRLGGIFKGLSDLLNVAHKMAEVGQRETSKTRVVKDIAGIKGSKAVIGYSIKVSPGGMPLIEKFGNIFEGEEGPVVDEKREPLVDVFEEKDKIRVVAELPGVEEKDINLKVKDDGLRIFADTKDRKYRKEIHLPSPANAKTLKWKYKNGVLEVSIKKE